MKPNTKISFLFGLTGVSDGVGGSITFELLTELAAKESTASSRFFTNVR